MTEVFSNIPIQMKKQAVAVFDLALRQQSICSALEVLSAYINSCRSPEEKEFVRFYFSMMLQEKSNESNND